MILTTNALSRAGFKCICEKGLTVPCHSRDSVPTEVGTPVSEEFCNYVIREHSNVLGEKIVPIQCDRAITLRACRIIHSSVREAFLAATDPEFKNGEKAMSEAIGEGVIEGMVTVLNKEGPTIGKTIQQQLGPIMQMMIRQEIAPAIKDTLKNQIAPAALQVWKEGAAETLQLTVRPDMQPDVRKNSENASIGASEGTTRGLIKAGILSSKGGLSPQVEFYLWAILIAAGLIIVALFCLLVMLKLLVLYYWRHRRDAKEDKPKAA